jgi:hypothetical protein
MEYRVSYIIGHQDERHEQTESQPSRRGYRQPHHQEFDVVTGECLIRWNRHRIPLFAEDRRFDGPVADHFSALV